MTTALQLTSYQAAVLEFRIQFCLQAVRAAGGNVCAASRITGIHRNTLCRLLRAGGYAPRQLRRQVHQEARQGGAE